MSKNIKKLYITIFVILCLFVVAIFKTTPSQPKNSVPLFDQGGARSGNFASATLSAGNVKIKISAGTSLYDALTEVRKENKIEFSGRDYPGLGFFVTDIGTLHAGDGKYLFYYINGKEASVGVSSYKLKDGDIIEWKLK